MNMKRRDFIGTALAAGVTATASSLGAQAPAAPLAPAARRRRGSRPPKVEKLWNIPSYKAMNALEAAPGWPVDWRPNHRKSVPRGLEQRQDPARSPVRISQHQRAGGWRRLHLGRLQRQRQ